MNAVFAESNSSADYLAFFLYQIFAVLLHLSNIPTEFLLNKCSFYQDFLHCVCQRIERQVCG